MPKYKVKAGMIFGSGDHVVEAGGTVELTEEEAAPFMDKLDLVKKTTRAKAPVKAAAPRTGTRPKAD